jgi:hypothetical protein
MIFSRPGLLIPIVPPVEMRPIIPPSNGGVEENPWRREQKATVNIRGLFSESARRERNEAKRRMLVSEYYTVGEMEAMTPEELEIAAQCISAGTCLCGRMPIFIDGAVCPGCLSGLSRAIQGGLGIDDTSFGHRANMAMRRSALPRGAKKKLKRRRSESP